MRTLLLVIVCVAGGYGIAKYSVDQKQAAIKNQIGLARETESKSSSTMAESDAVETKMVDLSPSSATSKKTGAGKSGSGKIEVVGGLEYDFGAMKKGTKRSHTFIFRNVGSTPVKLAYQSSTCKCTVGKLKDSVLEPNDQTDVEMEWVAENISEQFAQVATLSTDAPGQEEIKLTIKGKIGEGHVFEPSMFDFGDTLATEDKTMEGKLFLFEGQHEGEVESSGLGDSTRGKYVDVKILEVKDLKPGEIESQADARRMIRFAVTIKKGMPAGRLTSTIPFRLLGVENGESIMFQIQCRSASVVSVVGGRDYNEENNILSMGTARTKEGLSKKFLLKIRHLNGVVPQVKVAKVSPEIVAETIRVSVGEPSVSGSQSLFPVTIEAPVGCKPCEMDGSFSKDFGKIVFETNVESAPEFPMFFKFKITE
jgi:hypothetical protein